MSSLFGSPVSPSPEFRRLVSTIETFTSDGEPLPLGMSLLEGSLGANAVQNQAVGSHRVYAYEAFNRIYKMHVMSHKKDIATMTDDTARNSRSKAALFGHIILGVELPAQKESPEVAEGWISVWSDGEVDGGLDIYRPIIQRDIDFIRSFGISNSLLSTSLDTKAVTVTINSSLTPTDMSTLATTLEGYTPTSE